MQKCFKEWNAVIEALGIGKQSILIRKYRTNVKEFLLYPTISYALKDNYLDVFQEKHKDFVSNNSLPKIKDDNVEIKYFASVDKIEDISPSKAVSMSKYCVWNRKHIKNYLQNKKGYVWLLRVHELEKPVFASAKRAAITFAELNKDISLKNSQPVLSDQDFKNFRSEIMI